MAAKKKTRKTLEAQRREEVVEGCRRLAYGSCNDAVRLLFCDEACEDLAKMDLFNVSEIKRPKDGAMEIKFYSRFEAMERLVQLDGLTELPDGVKAFYEAIERSVDS